MSEYFLVRLPTKMPAQDLVQLLGGAHNGASAWPVRSALARFLAALLEPPVEAPPG